MKTAFQKDEALLAEVHRTLAAGDFRLWWLGQSGFLVVQAGRALLLDPYLSDSLTKKYAGTDKPHVRMTERVVEPERLDFVDLVTASHGHTDHLDPETLQPLARANPRLVLVCPEAIRATARERSGLPGERIIGLDAGGPSSSFVLHPSSLSLHAVPAAHESVELDASGRHLFLGYVVKVGPWTLYHSGDTVRYDGLAELLRPHRIDVALLPINGRAPERRVAGNLNGAEAAQLAKDIGAGLVIPCHYDLFEFNTAAPELFVETCRRLGQPCRVLRNGEGLTL